MGLLLLCLLLPSLALQRHEVGLRFAVTSTGDGYFFGLARSQTHITTASGDQLCYSFLSSPPGAASAQWTAHTEERGSSFSGNATVSFAVGDLVLSSPLPGTSSRPGGAGSAFFLANIPYQITGGTDEFAGATGAAATIAFGDGSSGRFELILLAVFYLPVSSETKPAASAPVMRRQQEGSCVHPGLVVAGYSVDTLVTTFVSTPSSNTNKAFAPQQALFSSALLATSTVYALDNSLPFLYESTVGSPSPTTFNESGTISIAGSDTSFDFRSTTDGTVYQAGAISLGSIAYAVSNGKGSLTGATGVMIDVFESFPNQTTFPISVVAVLVKPVSGK
jgi:hypothetical protein